MMKLQALQPNAAVRGILPDSAGSVVTVQWLGSEAQALTCKDLTGKIAIHLVYRHDEPRLGIVEAGCPRVDGDGAAFFRLASETHLFAR